MSHRTDGATRNCKGCRFWSEMIARAVGGGPVEAMCLAKESKYRAKYTSPTITCDQWKSGHLGAVDEPGQDPKAYDNEEQSDAN